MPRRRDVDSQREQLSRAVWSVLAEQGLPGLTVRAVAERAGCTTGLVMHAFAGRHELLVHARRLLHERAAESADAAEAGAAGPAERLRAVLRQAACLTPAGRERARVRVAFLAAAAGDEELAAVHRQNNRVFVRRVERLLAEAAPDLPRAQREVRARSLVALVEGLNCLAAADPATYPARAQTAALDDAVRAATS
ncbi:TetR/AcrR family transcriptional regulator [Kineococcus indalonis]|uniref:TetR/AcrR family transcriptional regulator n=1 Tax=Kineococcus indalonis TaxID=2696566 RepID=UPI0014121BB0|nr:TetR family transcriptional regulator C-terminal domain-containing protein [Kineococcus indalonis]NAZ86666.1 TetR family transcriptional regulator [Kineococcus indalonis]